MKHRVLVVEDEPSILDTVVYALETEGISVVGVGTCAEASARILAEPFDLLILDVGLPDGSGMDLCKQVRATSAVPVIFLTARSSEVDRIVGLEIGGDDYVVKPFSPRELVLRVQSVLRRATSAAETSEQTPAAVRTAGDLVLDEASRRVWRNGTVLTLTSREFDLLAFLMARPGVAFTRAELLRQVWGWSFGDESTVTVHVRRLREKIETDPANPGMLATVWGHGYRWDSGP